MYNVFHSIQDAGFLIATTIDSFKIRDATYIVSLVTNVAQFLRDDMPDRVMALAISIFNILVPQFPEKITGHHIKYVGTACYALRNDYPHAQLHATRAIGISVKFGKDEIGISVSECLARLYAVIAKRLSISEQSEDVASLCDTAVAALGKLCEYHRDSIDGPTYILVRWTLKSYCQGQLLLDILLEDQKIGAEIKWKDCS
ncbi:hypothetical protein MtrunA17_Chr3g0110031 [Medicago truncatula]|uniref:Uncharacterized protein n=1 Tax=Medicago truncatula TaxID=3880 RepID=A0A396IUF3_MEDTR|nr:hypothetical protein MtrunA17_Chr3g0110031 [Medicago truncatula]